jgi:hypothetical protein
MVYAVGLADPQPRIDSVTDCGHCCGQIVWDEVHGWLHIDGWVCLPPSVERRTARGPGQHEQGAAMSSRAEAELGVPALLSLCKQANEDWQRLARISEQVAEQFMADSPHGGDIQAPQVTFVSATQKIRSAPWRALDQPCS